MCYVVNEKHPVLLAVKPVVLDIRVPKAVHIYAKPTLES